jgi:hypothetical protein
MSANKQKYLRQKIRIKKRSQKSIERKGRDINLETCNLKNEKNRKNYSQKKLS